METPSTFLICYDLHKPNQNYSELISAIQEDLSGVRVNASCWIIKSFSSAVKIRDTLTEYIDSDDDLFVCRFDGWASYGIPQKVINWLKEDS